MKVSVIIPCYNEKNTIEKIIEAVHTAPVQNKEIIVVDDCSNDGTRTLLRDKLSGAVDRIIYHPVNRGKGAALRQEGQLEERHESHLRHSKIQPPKRPELSDRTYARNPNQTGAVPL